MQIHRTFIWQLDQEYGNYGWILEDAPTGFNTGDGLMVTHDTMEHLKPSDGSLQEELMAFGAIMLVRAEPGYFGMRGRGSGDPAIHTAADIHGFMREYFLADKRLPEPPATRALHNHEDIEDIIQRAMSLARRGFREDFSYQELDELPSDTAILNFLNKCVGWMRIGVVRAKRAYRFNKGHDLMYAFTSIEELVNKEYMHCNEGDKLHVKLDTRTLKWRVWYEPLEDQWQEEQEDEDCAETT